MRLPRDISGLDLVKALAALGYKVSRQTGSHIRMTTESPSQHHVTVPAHDPIRLGTLSAILADVAEHQKISREALLMRLNLS
ncbi:MAG: type II toxin-antitoxin system HicA family toxin [Betaproteobacteria bacterium]|nr:type II toxin-antitoxin system HicA family toxin [Betaproteobacteria bacterium]